jgi:2-methylisocitrate lyase-like PEP mutase family enzyme
MLPNGFFYIFVIFAWSCLFSKSGVMTFNTLFCKANMLEGGKTTLILSQLGEIGFSIVACPLSLVGVPMRAMQVCFSFVNVKQMKLLAFS